MSVWELITLAWGLFVLALIAWGLIKRDGPRYGRCPRCRESLTRGEEWLNYHGRLHATPYLYCGRCGWRARKITNPYDRDQYPVT